MGIIIVRLRNARGTFRPYPRRKAYADEMPFRARGVFFFVFIDNFRRVYFARGKTRSPLNVFVSTITTVFTNSKLPPGCPDGPILRYVRTVNRAYYSFRSNEIYSRLNDRMCRFFCVLSGDGGVIFGTRVPVA